MKRFLVLFMGLMGIILSTVAQDHTILLFDSFVTGKIHFKNHAVTTASMNYDAGHGRILYQQNEELMELTNSFMVDSVSFGQRQFIPMGKSYAEKIPTEHGTVYVNWVLKDVNVGSKGAYGMPTHGKVESLKSYDFGLSSETYTAYDKQAVKSTDMFRRKNANTYYISVNGEMKEIKSTKQLIKLYPQKEKEIRQYMSDTKVNLKEPYKALQLLDFCLSLEDSKK